MTLPSWISELANAALGVDTRLQFAAFFVVAIVISLRLVVTANVRGRSAGDAGETARERMFKAGLVALLVLATLYVIVIVVGRDRDEAPLPDPPKPGQPSVETSQPVAADMGKRDVGPNPRTPEPPASDPTAMADILARHTWRVASDTQCDTRIHFKLLPFSLRMSQINQNRQTRTDDFRRVSDGGLSITVTTPGPDASEQVVEVYDRVVRFLNERRSEVIEEYVPCDI